MKPEAYFWQIESLWEQYFYPKENTILVSGHDPLFPFPPDIRAYYVPHHRPDWSPSIEPVFTDEKGQTFSGLRQQMLLHRSGKPIFLVDNHQKVLPAISWFSEQQDEPVHLVHIDAHRDDAMFSFSVSPQESFSFQEVCRLTEKARVSDYLDLGKKLGIIDAVTELTQEGEFLNVSLPKNPFLLNLDIDIYGEEGSAVDLALKTKVISEVWAAADAICIATSPGFIDQGLAHRILDIFLR